MNTSNAKHHFKTFGSVYLTQSLFNFSFYGIRSIFVLYAIQRFSLTTGEAISLFATFMALCYGTSLIGGYMADRGLGVKNTVLAGGIFSALGLLLVLFPSPNLRFLGLALASLGSGFFKPSLPTAAGLLFEDPKDPEKDKVFSFLYIAMNIGGLIASLACGFVGQHYGWHYGIIFIASIFAFSTYFSYKTMRLHPTYRENLTWPKSKIGAIHLCLMGSLWLLFKYQEYGHGLMGVIVCASVACFYKIFYACQRQERRDVLTIALYILLSTLYGALYEQAGTSLMLFCEKAVDRHILGTVIPSSAFLSLDPLFVLIFGPVLLFLSGKYLENKKAMGGFLKIGCGFLSIALAFGTLALGASQGGANLVSPWWVVAAMFVQTLGEIWIVPIIFSKISQNAPARFKGILMSFWSMSIAYGHYLAGFMAKSSLGDATSFCCDDVFGKYQLFFESLSLLALGVGLSLLLGQGVKLFLIRYRKFKVSLPARYFWVSLIKLNRYDN